MDPEIYIHYQQIYYQLNDLIIRSAAFLTTRASKPYSWKSL